MTYECPRRKCIPHTSIFCFDFYNALSDALALFAQVLPSLGFSQTAKSHARRTVGFCWQWISGDMVPMPVEESVVKDFWVRLLQKKAESMRSVIIQVNRRA